jgi:hypothetical protein
MPNPSKPPPPQQQGRRSIDEVHECPHGKFKGSSAPIRVAMPQSRSHCGIKSGTKSDSLIVED